MCGKLLLTNEAKTENNVNEWIDRIIKWIIK